MSASNASARMDDGSARCGWACASAAPSGPFRQGVGHALGDEEIFPQVHLARRARQDDAADDDGLDARQVALGVIGEAAVEIIGDGGAEDGIAEELQPLVAAAQFGLARGVRQRVRQQGAVAEPVAERRFEFGERVRRVRRSIGHRSVLVQWNGKVARAQRPPRTMRPPLMATSEIYHGRPPDASGKGIRRSGPITSAASGRS